jgi:hypothetical protein
MLLCVLSGDAGITFLALRKNLVELSWRYAAFNGAIKIQQQHIIRRGNCGWVKGTKGTHNIWENKNQANRLMNTTRIHVPSRMNGRMSGLCLVSLERLPISSSIIAH